MKIHQRKGYFWSSVFQYTPKVFNDSKNNELLCLIFIFCQHLVYGGFLNEFYGMLSAVAHLKPDI